MGTLKRKSKVLIGKLRIEETRNDTELGKDS